MTNAKRQMQVAKSFVEHLETKIALNCSDEEFLRFRKAKIEFLDTVADLLNNPKIAVQWDNPLRNALDEERVEDKVQVRTPSENLDAIIKDMDKQAKFQLNLICGLAVFAYVVCTAVYLYGNFHGVHSL